MNEVLVIVPTYNERSNLEPLVRAIEKHVPGADLLIVDDASPDGTGAFADSLRNTFPQLHVLHRTGKRGLGLAYCDGFAWALERDYAAVVQMDADFSHDPADVPRLVEAASRHDVVIGSRYLGGVRVVNWPKRRLFLSTSAARYVRIITGMPLTDPTAGFKCLKRSALEQLDISKVQSNGYGFQVEINHRLWRQGLDVAEIPIVFTERREGVSKMSLAIIVEALFSVWTLWWQNGLRRSPRASPKATARATSNATHP